MPVSGSSDAIPRIIPVAGVMAVLISKSKAKAAATDLTQYSLALLFSAKVNTCAKMDGTRRLLCNDSSSTLFCFRVLFLMVWYPNCFYKGITCTTLPHMQ